MTSNHHALYDLGYTRATMAGTQGSKTVKLSKTQKACPSSDCTLQLECMKLELLVIADQNAAVNAIEFANKHNMALVTIEDLVAYRQAHERKAS